MARGRPARWNPLIARRHGHDGQRFRLGVPLGGAADERYSDEQLKSERLEFSVRLHAHERRLTTKASTQLERDLAYNEAERLALGEMRKLQRNGGRWKTLPTPAAGRATGRPVTRPDLLAEFQKLQRRSGGKLSVRSAARILAERSETASAVESRLRRRIKSASKLSRK